MIWRGFEHRSDPLLPRRRFVRRVARTLLAGMIVVAASLAIGMLGYHCTEGMGWLDAYANAAMILSGMGPLAAPQTGAGKLFAGSYALYSGLVVMFLTGLLFAPFAHRLLHRFHLERDKGSSQP
ncbi:hypothetical protein MBSD_n1546 [Mizugakiibacter sediminis]|uniref:Two pore domain potassium channel family protein n=1 Tax=Mizugakiibacter sediminis TaxID=1475481 RepID=A0A0K8QPA6_9GAMM|nr:hypothetical protein [Mizugakiibacter sediminis]GAP66242.1 hypothetical protein MBSD_n1546 [Mizugakiibacter sediminis]